MVRITFAVGFLALTVLSDVFSTAQAEYNPDISFIEPTSDSSGNTPPPLGELLQGFAAQDQEKSNTDVEGQVNAQELMPEAPASFGPEMSDGTSSPEMADSGIESIPAIGFGESSGLDEMSSNLDAGGTGPASVASTLPKKCSRPPPQSLAPPKCPPKPKCHRKDASAELQQGQWGGQGQGSAVTGGGTCDGKTYASSTHQCNRMNGREYLCPLSHDSCGNACYMPSKYSCQNGQLVPTGSSGGGGGGAQQTQWRPDQQQQGQWQPQGQQPSGQQLPGWQQGQQQQGQLPDWQSGQQQPWWQQDQPQQVSVY